MKKRIRHSRYNMSHYIKGRIGIYLSEMRHNQTNKQETHNELYFFGQKKFY